MAFFPSTCNIILQIFFPRSIGREAGYSPRRSTTGKADVSFKCTHGHPSQPQDDFASLPDVPHSQPSYVFNYPPTKPRTLIIQEDEIYDLEEYYDEAPSFILGGSSDRRTEVWEIVTPPPVATTRNRFSDAYGSSVAFNLNPGEVDHARTGAIPERPERHDLNPLLINYVRTSSITRDDSQI